MRLFFYWFGRRPYDGGGGEGPVVVIGPPAEHLGLAGRIWSHLS